MIIHESDTPEFHSWAKLFQAGKLFGQYLGGMQEQVTMNLILQVKDPGV